MDTLYIDTFNFHIQWHCKPVNTLINIKRNWMEYRQLEMTCGGVEDTIKNHSEVWAHAVSCQFDARTGCGATMNDVVTPTVHGTYRCRPVGCVPELQRRSRHTSNGLATRTNVSTSGGRSMRGAAWRGVPSGPGEWDVGVVVVVINVECCRSSSLHGTRLASHPLRDTHSRRRIDANRRTDRQSAGWQRGWSGSLLIDCAACVVMLPVRLLSHRSTLFFWRRYCCAVVWPKRLSPLVVRVLAMRVASCRSRRVSDVR